MSSLIYNELLKTWYRNRVKWFLIIVLGLYLILSFSLRIFLNEGALPPAAIFLSLSQTFINGTFLLFYGVIITTSAITSEFHKGTIKQLAIRPISRLSILGSKLLSGFLAILMLIIVVNIVIYLVSVLLFDASTASENLFVTAALTCLYQIPTYVFYLCLSVLIGTLFKSTTVAVVLFFVIDTAGNMITGVLHLLDWNTSYFIYPNLLLEVYSDNEIIKQPMIMGAGEGLLFSLTIIFVYSLVLAVIGFYRFQKQDIA
ncbi:ABC transporter permease [Pontibacillus salipaludis]|uniref:Bacitracin ABC transporter permease n=1 Tax=Pontibacillus salipaludis TaxID=1697394 RepID=A0ABQ1QCP4_9BACI|nr:ABC transporter permease [Pontibacillus salipaludis]GGD23231.1 bacitracin ABC transporter permease [Pontibacillus salipaludis]